jgi:hypothetical protein
MALMLSVATPSRAQNAAGSAPTGEDAQKRDIIASIGF